MLRAGVGRYDGRWNQLAFVRDTNPSRVRRLVAGRAADAAATFGHFRYGSSWLLAAVYVAPPVAPPMAP